MYKFIIYNVELLQIKQKNRIINKKIYRYIMTINNIDNNNVTLKYIETYNKYIKEFKGLTIHNIQQNLKGDPLLNNCYLYNKDGTYQKYFYERELI